MFKHGIGDELTPASSRGDEDGTDSHAHQVERWLRVKALFLEAIERSESEREVFLTAACGADPGLRAEVDSLLASERAAASFGETPAASLLPGLPPEEAPPAPRLAPGSRLGTYEIESFLSAGGMGEVYRARHTVLDRLVAIKTLGVRATGPVSNRRLIREARNASVLDHPGICKIHEIGESAKVPFIVMEFVDGRPVSEILEAAPPALVDAIDWGMQIADALDHAHRHGIVHRDLKSSNVVVGRDGRVVILDFGLARRLPGAPGGAPHSTLTVQGALVGTLSHMAPEVLQGGTADTRSDVWSLGVLLYELTTGDLPFRGRTPFETSSAILNEPPRPMARSLPLSIRLVIERCLVKEPAARCQRASDVRSALYAIRRRRAWPLVGRLLVATRRRQLYATITVSAVALTVALAGIRFGGEALDVVGARASTLALMPLENATGDPSSEYYAQGLTEALTGQLGTLANVRVISRASAARVAQTAQTRAQAARQLGARILVEGRLREASDRIVVDVRIIEPGRGRVLWSDTWERTAGQVLALQADIVRALAAEIRLTVGPGGRERLATTRAVNPEAYEEYLKGRYDWNRRTDSSLESAVAHFTRAIELDPTYAPAHAALADCLNQFGTLMVGTGSPREFRPRAAAAAIRALQIDPWSAEAHATLGYIRHYDWQFEDAEREFARAIELNPSYSMARIWYANLLMSRGRTEEALEQVHAAQELDPFSLIVRTNVGWVLNVAGRFDEAAAQLTSALELDSSYVHARWRLADALRGAGRYTEAYDQAVQAAATTGRTPPALQSLAKASAALGRMDEVRAIRDELLEQAPTAYIPPGIMTDVFVLLGDTDSALEWASRAFDERANYVLYMSLDTLAGPLQRDPRFRAMVDRAGLR